MQRYIECGLRLPRRCVGRNHDGLSALQRGPHKADSTRRAASDEDNAVTRQVQRRERSTSNRHVAMRHRHIDGGDFRPLPNGTYVCESLVDLEEVESPSPACKAGVLPLNERPTLKLVFVLLGFRQFCFTFSTHPWGHGGCALEPILFLV